MNYNVFAFILTKNKLLTIWKYHKTFLYFVLVNESTICLAQLAGIVEYTDCNFEEG